MSASPAPIKPPSTTEALLEPYGEAYQRRQAEKFRGRKHNRWKVRCDLAHRLVDEHALPRLARARSGEPEPGAVTVLDVGCSIGTFAIEMAHRGFNAFGVDLDETALTIARELADEEGVSPGFVLGDAADFSQSHGEIDIAIAFDIFEHLFDDQLGAMLVALRRQLAPGGSLVFHTFPSELDYLLFWGDERAAAFLEPFKDAEPAHFDRLVKTYAAMRNAWEVLNTGQTHSEKIAPTSHPNPLSAERLRARG